MDDTRKKAIVAMLAKDFSTLKVARANGISGETFRRHYHEDPEFHNAVDEARELYVTRLRDEVYRRGVEGWNEPVFYKGDKCGDIRRYDSSLLLAHLKRYDPSYREASKIDVKAEHSGTISSGLEQLSPEGRAALRGILEAEIARREKAKDDAAAADPS
jgi:hypothetical protein